MRQRYSAFHSFAQRVASTTGGAWLLSRVMHPLDRLVLRLSAGRMTAANILAGLPIMVVEMKGARTGLRRTAPLIYVQIEAEPDRIALIATNWGRSRLPSWYHNLKAHPQVRGTMAGRQQDYRAHEATAAEYERFWQAGVATYRGYAAYKNRIHGRHIPIIILEPGQASSNAGEQADHTAEIR